MRIDRYLHCIRLLKSRTLAQAVIDEGRTRIDGRRVAKASETVRVGSVIALPLNGKVRVLRVLSLPDRRGPATEARTAYEELHEGNAGACIAVDEAAPAF
jgi:ribosome-associated heat shock protein Hsp15